MSSQNGLGTLHNTSEPQNCFVGSSYKAPWHDDIISACEEALPKFGLRPWYADDQFEPTKSLRDKVVEMVANARYGIYDLSWWRSDERSAWKMPQNVLIELGMAIALNRPVLMLRHAENRVASLQLPACLDSQQIVEFSGEYTLRCALEERLPQWLDVPPERAWWTRYCLFGQRICTYRESYPQAEQYRQELIHCHISDGQDTDRDDFRYMLESELDRYSDVSYDYLDSLAPAAGYNFLLCTHCQMVRSTPFAIYRITPQTTAETFVAIGMSIALEKQFKCEIPKFIFTTDARSVPSLLSGNEVVETKTTKERQERLRRFLPIVMRKVRENMWKPEPLPFIEFVPRSVELPEPGKEIEADKLKREVENRDEDALRLAEEAIRLHPRDAQAYNNKGSAAANLRRYEEALLAFSDAIQLESGIAEFYYNRGNIYFTLKKYQQAIADFDQALGLNGEFSSARRQRDIAWDIISSTSNVKASQNDGTVSEERSAIPGRQTRIFISSTWQDLQSEREAVERALHRMQDTSFASVQYFGSRPDTPEQFSLMEVERCDIYVGIFAHRYGSGITEKEYRRARARNIPCLIYFKDDTVPVPPVSFERDPAAVASLEAFKNELQAQHVVSLFVSPDNLASQVLADLHNRLGTFQ